MTRRRPSPTPAALAAQNDAMRALYRADATTADIEAGRQLAAKARRLSWLIRESRERELTADERQEIEATVGPWNPQR